MSFMSGFGVAAARLGMPDTGLISVPEMLDQLRNICNSVPGYPIIGDGDTGYGNAATYAAPSLNMPEPRRLVS
jgi:2-methylisocitrate lyase-like PEP mutase family enzyme